MSKEIVKTLYQFAKFIKQSPDTVKAFLQHEYIKDRSHNQNAYYWGVMLPAVYDNLPETIKLPNIPALHIYLKFYFCYEWRNDLFQIGYVKTLEDNVELAYFPFSFAFDKLKHKDAVEYLEYVKQWVKDKIGCELEVLIFGITKDIKEQDND